MQTLKNDHMKLLILLVTFCSSSILFSQDKTLGFNIEETIKVNDSIQPLNFDTPNKGKIFFLPKTRVFIYIFTLPPNFQTLQSVPQVN